MPSPYEPVDLQRVEEFNKILVAAKILDETLVKHGGRHSGQARGSIASVISQLVSFNLLPIDFDQFLPQQNGLVAAQMPPQLFR